MLTVCILYGFGEGPRVGAHFERALTAKGYRIVRNAGRADIIITHSGGYLLVPQAIRAKQIIHIAPYRWPGKSWLVCIGAKLLNDLHAHHREGELAFWIRKSCWNFVYMWRLPANIRMLKRLQSPAIWRHGNLCVVVRPRFDTFCTPRCQELPFRPSAAYLSLGKHHDDCWRHPHTYLDLLQS